MEISLSIIGLTCLIAGIIFYRNGKRLLQKGKKTKGKVVDLVKRSGISNDNPMPNHYYHPIISFETSDGHPVQKELNFGSHPSRYSKGQSVVVIYDPEDPSDCNVHSKFQIFGPPVICISFGLAALIAATIIYLVNH